MKLNELRNKIDEIDWQIIKLIRKRFNLVQKIKKEKTRFGMSAIDQSRENKVIKKLKVLSKELNLRSRFVTELFNLIIKESRRIQEI